MRKSKLPGFTGSFDFGILPELRYFNTHIFLKRTTKQHNSTKELTPRGYQAHRAYLLKPYANSTKNDKTLVFSTEKNKKIRRFTRAIS